MERKVKTKHNFEGNRKYSCTMKSYKPIFCSQHWW